MFSKTHTTIHIHSECTSWCNQEADCLILSGMGGKRHYEWGTAKVDVALTCWIKVSSQSVTRVLHCPRWVPAMSHLPHCPPCLGKQPAFSDFSDLLMFESSVFVSSEGRNTVVWTNCNLRESKCCQVGWWSTCRRLLCYVTSQSRRISDNWFQGSVSK